MARMFTVDGGRVRLDRVEGVEIISAQTHSNQTFKVMLFMMSGYRAYIKQGDHEGAIATAKLICDQIEQL